MQPQSKEICWNLINSLLAGVLVLLGSLAASETINFQSLMAALIAFGIAAVIQFKRFWEKEESEYLNKQTLFKFV